MIAATAEESSEKCLATHFDATTVDRAASRGVHLCASNSAVKTRLQQSSSSELPGLSRDSATSPAASSTTASSSQYSRNLVLKRDEWFR